MGWVGLLLPSSPPLPLCRQYQWVAHTLSMEACRFSQGPSLLRGHNLLSGPAFHTCEAVAADDRNGGTDGLWRPPVGLEPHASPRPGGPPPSRGANTASRGTPPPDS